MARKRKETYRVPMGIHVMGGTNYPPCAFQIYQIRYDDGTMEIERGNTVYSLPGIMPTRQKKLPPDIRPDLITHMRVILAVQEDISNACYDLDVPKPKKAKKIRK